MAGRANALCLFLSRGDDLQQHIYRVSEVNQHIKQLIDADRECFGQPGQVIQRQSPLAGFQPAQRRQVDAGPVGDVLQCQPLLGAQLTQPSPHPEVDAALIAVCRHGN